PLQQSLSVRDPKKIEVMEIFRYGCIHCYRFDPLVKKWEKTLAKDVDFYRLPVVWGGETDLQARALFTAQAFGIADKIHDAMFSAIWNAPGAPAPLNSEARIKQLFLNEKIDGDKFDKVFDKSPAINSRVNEAKAKLLAYKPTPDSPSMGTPEILVAGKYRISGAAFHVNSEHEAFAKMLEVADYLIGKERKEMAAAAGK
ncbi:MAG TPA: thiol:disulfide interchange protein DsbA/DsbL, partial [Spongiibacteraceae bacterium]|nr:thiol:disulfide interchange protein DsbA/DsbL [Spongiibacteraceae bacterium]